VHARKINSNKNLSKKQVCPPVINRYAHCYTVVFASSIIRANAVLNYSDFSIVEKLEKKYLLVKWEKVLFCVIIWKKHFILHKKRPCF